MITSTESAVGTEKRLVKQDKLQAACLLVLALACLELQAARTPRFTIKDFGTFPGSERSAAGDINNSGAVLGVWYDSNDLGHTFLYWHGVMTEILAPAGVVWGRRNDLGELLGHDYTPGGDFHSFYLSQAGVLDLNEHLGRFVIAVGLNNRSQIVGLGRFAEGVTRGFVLQNGRFQFLEPLPGDNYSDALDVNNAGQIVGTSGALLGPEGPFFFQAVLYENGTATGLGRLPGGANSYGQAISDAGHVVGFADSSEGADGYLHAFLYQDHQMRDLGVLPGDTESRASSVNIHGQVTGHSANIPRDTPPRPFLFSDGTLYDLNDLVVQNPGWNLVGAAGINNRSQIVGAGFFQGKLRAFLLMPSK